jgi:hypothetical protein
MSSTFDSSADPDFRHQKSIFEAVVNAYRAVRSSHPLAASSPNQDSPPNKRLTFNSIDFAVDVEHATAFALKGPNQTALQQTWVQLVAEDGDADAEIAAEVIRRTSMVYDKRDLDPALYFRAIRRGVRRAT